jgi:hypothetical protein
MQALDEILPNRLGVETTHPVILSAAKNPGSLFRTLRTSGILRCAQNDRVLDCPTDLGIPSQTACAILQLDGTKAGRLEFVL